MTPPQRLGHLLVGAGLLVSTSLACDREPGEAAERSSKVLASAATETPSAPPPPPSAAPKPPVFEGTAGIVERGPTGGIARLATVRSARHEGFDRVVFEFAGKTLPGYHVEYIDKPVRQCGSGETTPIRGDGWLEVRLAPAEAHDRDGGPTAAPRERLVDHPIVREIELTCDFEANVTWVLGTASPNRYRVLELREPTRLVVDVRHR